MAQVYSLAAILFLTSCSPQYEVTAEKERNEPGLSDEVDTGLVDSGDTAPEEEEEEEIPEDSGSSTAPEKDDPIAVCEATPNPVHPPFEDADWIGEDSYDPEGGTITTYTWTLISSPSGSAVSMPSGSGPNRRGFTPDLAGDYTAELVVATGDGRTSDPCEVTLESIPTEELWVEMYWTNSGDDMDLHMLRPGGTLESSGDCYYMNCVGGGLNWGSASSTADDPTLDLDDIPGTGPENINIDSPQSGTYTVVVHDYPGSVYQGANSVTVNIYMNGALEWTDTRSISGENTYTYYAEVDWANGRITDL